jgi:hypothetical protein
MSEPAWADIQRPGAIASYVLPLLADWLDPRTGKP